MARNWISRRFNAHVLQGCSGKTRALALSIHYGVWADRMCPWCISTKAKCKAQTHILLLAAATTHTMETPLAFPYFIAAQPRQWNVHFSGISCMCGWQDLLLWKWNGKVNCAREINWTLQVKERRINPKTVHLTTCFWFIYTRRAQGKKFNILRIMNALTLFFPPLVQLLLCIISQPTLWELTVRSNN